MPERLIFHVDVNSAFLSWEAVWRLRQGETTDLRTIPSIVGGDREKRRGVVLAKSIPAKAFGVATGEPIVDALRKCPGLLCVPARHDLYSRCSRAFIEVLARFAPVGGTTRDVFVNCFLKKLVFRVLEHQSNLKPYRSDFFRLCPDVFSIQQDLSACGFQQTV